MLNDLRPQVLLNMTDDELSDTPSELEYGYQQRGSYLDFFIRIYRHNRLVAEFWLDTEMAEEFLAAQLDGLQEAENT